MSTCCHFNEWLNQAQSCYYYCIICRFVDQIKREEEDGAKLVFDTNVVKGLTS